MHTHLWKEKYKTFDYHIDSLSGYECECGAFLTIDDVTDILNGKVEIEHVILRPPANLR
jgi:hypothetical protein